MRINSKLRLSMWLAGLVASISPVLYRTTHPIQRPGDGWWTLWLFWAGVLCLVGLAVERTIRPRHRRYAH